MASTSVPTFIRLTPEEKRQIAAAAKRRGLSPAVYIKRAALEGSQAIDARLRRLEAVAATLLDSVENALDARMGDAAWDKHLAGKASLFSREEFLRDVDV